MCPYSNPVSELSNTERILMRRSEGSVVQLNYRTGLNGNYMRNTVDRPQPSESGHGGNFKRVSLPVRKGLALLKAACRPSLTARLTQTCSDYGRVPAATVGCGAGVGLSFTCIREQAPGDSRDVNGGTWGTRDMTPSSIRQTRRSRGAATTTGEAERPRRGLRKS